MQVTHTATMQVTHTAQVVSTTVISKGILLMTFKLLNPTMVDFKAGQYLAVFLPGEDKQSYYSIASSPNLSNHIELLVKEDTLGAGANYLFSLKVGDGVRFSMPMGEAFLREESCHKLVFVAGASGASYVRSMIHYLDETKQLSDREVYYFLGAQEEDELLELKPMMSLADKRSNFYFIPALSGATEWSGETGLITEVVERLMKDDLGQWDAYCAGSPAMVEAVADVLIDKKGLLAKNFYSDFYSPE